MQHRTLGATGLQVSALGIGLAEIGFQLKSTEAERAGAVLNAALDNGINFLDTAGCYGVSEELVGQTVAGRRDEFILASKTGHMSDGCEGDSWGYDCVSAGIDRSLNRLSTDVIDIMQLHSCGVDVLERGEAIQALQDARTAGKVRFIGYSGDNEAVLWAARSGEFDTIQTSFNLADQKARYELFPIVEARQLGLIVKRPILNGTWRVERDPDPYKNNYGGEYFRRQSEMTVGHPAFPDEPDDRILASLGFTLSHDVVSVAIVGSRNAEHVRSNIEMLESIPVSDAFVEAAHSRFDELGADWPQRT